MKTYKITGDNGLHETLKSLITLKISEETNVDLHIYAYDGEGQPDWTTRSLLKTAVDGISNITRKDCLYKLMHEHMAREYEYTEIISRGFIRKQGVFIIKPVGSMAFGGRGIQIVKKGDKFVSESGWNYVISDYIFDVLTFLDRKFHLRVYLFVTTWGEWKLHDKYRIILAKEKYEKGDWSNKDIHDTHLKSTEADYFFYPDGDLYIQETDFEIQQICSKIAHAIKPQSFPEAQYGFEMLGIDFLIKEDKTPVLLEVNNNAGAHVSASWYKQELASIYLELISKVK